MYEVKSFSNYLNSEYVDTPAFFSSELNDWHDINNCLNEHIFFEHRRTRKRLEKLLVKARNIEYLAVINGIKEVKAYHDIDNWFGIWIELVDSFLNLSSRYIEPLFYDCLRYSQTLYFDEEGKEGIEFALDNGMNISIIFERSEFKKSNATLFDTITGLDKNNNLTFVNITVEAEGNSNIKYEYYYVKDGSVKSNNFIDEDVELDQLDYIRNQTCDIILHSVELLFDCMLNRKIKNTDSYYYTLYSDCLIQNNYKDLRKQWLRNSITGTGVDEV
jgi:hypothetical protein